MIIFLLRVAASALLLTAPFALAALLSGKAGGTLYLIFPFVAAIPAALLIGLVFVPVEGLASWGGRSGSLNWLVPLVGAIVGGLAAAGYQCLERLTQAKPAGEIFGDLRVWGVIAVFGLLGAVVGAIWRLAAWAVRYFGWT